jgi:hypothetical protein
MAKPFRWTYAVAGIAALDRLSLLVRRELRLAAAAL